MSPGVLRARTADILKRRIAKFGEVHPATFAAYGRAFVAWKGRIRPPSLANHGYEIRTACAQAYTTAQIRAYEPSAHWDNRHKRRARARLVGRHQAVTLEDIAKIPRFVGEQVDPPASSTEEP